MQKTIEFLNRYWLWLIWIVLVIYLGLSSRLVISDQEIELLDIALSPEFSAKWLTSYFHIYFLKLFVLLGGNPMAGMRLYMGISLATLLVGTFAILGRLIPSSNSLAACIAVLLLFSKLIRVWLMPSLLPEITLALLFLGIAAIWFFFVNSDDLTNKRFALLAIGGGAVFAFRTALAGGIIFVLLLWVIGLGWKDDRWYALFYALTGVIVAFVIMSVFDALFLNDAFVFFRAGSWESWHELGYSELWQAKSFWYQYVVYGGFKEALFSWWRYIVKNNLLLLMLGLAALIMHWKKIVDNRSGVFLMLSLLYIVFQIILIKEVTPYRLLPFWVWVLLTLPILFDDVQIGSWWKTIKTFFGDPIVWLFLLGLIIFMNYSFAILQSNNMGIVLNQKYSILHPTNYNVADLYVAFGDILFLGMLILGKKRNFNWLAGVGIAILFMQFGNVPEFIRWNMSPLQGRFVPLSLVQDSFQCAEDTRIVYSEEFSKKIGYSRANADQTALMFELAFDCEIRNNQVALLGSFESTRELWDFHPTSVWVTKNEYLSYFGGRIVDSYELVEYKELVYLFGKVGE